MLVLTQTSKCLFYCKHVSLYFTHLVTFAIQRKSDDDKARLLMIHHLTNEKATRHRVRLLQRLDIDEAYLDNIVFLKNASQKKVRNVVLSLFSSSFCFL